MKQIYNSEIWTKLLEKLMNFQLTKERYYLHEYVNKVGQIKLNDLKISAMGIKERLVNLSINY